MAFQDEDGNNLTKTELLALTSEEATETILVVEADVYQTFTHEGAGFEGGSKLKFHTGQRVKESDVDALFAAATITSITPDTGGTAGGTDIVIDGTNFSGAEGVTVGGAAATDFAVVSNERITCTTPAGTAGAKDVVVLDDAGNVTETGGFTYA